MSDFWRHYNGLVKLSPFSLRSAEREQNEEKHIKNEMDVVYMFKIWSRSNRLKSDWVRTG